MRQAATRLGRWSSASRRALSSAAATHPHFYIGGRWVPPVRHDAGSLAVVCPATEEVVARVACGTGADIDDAVASAKLAFESWRRSAKEERLDLLRRLADVYKARSDEMAAVISQEMGAPISLARKEQAPAGLFHIRTFVSVLEKFEFEERFEGRDEERLVHDAIGVCGLFTPWNWPMNQVTLKVVPALAAGCTCVLKPSEVAPLSALLFAQMIDEAGFPPGCFNLVNGRGGSAHAAPGAARAAGEALAAHPDVDMVSFTGSTRAGVQVSKAAADGIKRVALELGGKGPNLIFADAAPSVRKAVERGVRAVLRNSGQSCNAPSRMLVERSVYAEAVEAAAEAARAACVGEPRRDGAHIGPVASRAQWGKVQGLIEAGVREGARLVAGGPGRPEGLGRGYYCRPTVFADVCNATHAVAREEIFGPVVCLIPFEDEAEAIAIANDTSYGLQSYVQTSDVQRARRVARALRAGMVTINYAPRAPGSPFGGVRHSGIGREGGELGLREFLEVKAVSGWTPE